ncbi:hypothetical protein HC766_05395 [Candidatus Gracilibacteria bacterium]|nr:hypothetical protein [Candidatus Gracilibacteria bacterium]
MNKESMRVSYAEPILDNYTHLIGIVDIGLPKILSLDRALLVALASSTFYLRNEELDRKCKEKLSICLDRKLDSRLDTYLPLYVRRDSDTNNRYEYQTNMQGYRPIEIFTDKCLRWILNDNKEIYWSNGVFNYAIRLAVEEDKNSLCDELTKLKNEIPKYNTSLYPDLSNSHNNNNNENNEIYDNGNNKIYTDWLESNEVISYHEQWETGEIENWIGELRKVMMEYCEIGDDWQKELEDEEREKFKQYYNGNNLLVDCLEIALKQNNKTEKTEILYKNLNPKYFYQIKF